MKQKDSTNNSFFNLREIVQNCKVLHHVIKDDGTYPNNERLPLLAYKDALKLPSENPAPIIERIFEKNKWNGSWRNGIYGFHHYHSTAHEVLGVCSGNAKAQFGGEKGITITVSCGDLVVIPAGVSHKNLGATLDFLVVGAYPRGQHPDMCYGKSGERPETDQNINHVSLPELDPVYGSKGPIVDHWLK